MLRVCSCAGLKRGEKKPKVARGKHKKRALLAKKILERAHGKLAKANEKVPEKLEQPTKKTPREAPTKTRSGPRSREGDAIRHGAPQPVSCQTLFSLMAKYHKMISFDLHQNCGIFDT